MKADCDALYGNTLKDSDRLPFTQSLYSTHTKTPSHTIPSRVNCLLKILTPTGHGGAGNVTVTALRSAPKSRTNVTVRGKV